MESIQEQLVNFINENFIYGRSEVSFSLKTDQSLLDSGIIDSTGVMELVTFIESKYGIKVKVEELIPENLDSVDNILRLLKTKNVN